MIRKFYILTGVILTASTLVATSTPASALNDKDILSLNVTQPFVLQLQQPEPLPIVRVDTPAPKPPEPVTYTVAAGDNLTHIAAANDTSWLRLWNKNTDITSPDLILPGQVFVIPDVNEQLADRPVPVAVVQALSAPVSPTAAPRGVVAGNTYDAGYCTWYVKNRRPDISNSLGNANTWYVRASAQGYDVGTVPRAGAVGTTERGSAGHVVYVEYVIDANTIMISEMNYHGLYSQRTRPAAASEFRYIY